MTVEEVVKKIGVSRLQEFLGFMGGQTVGINDDGTTDYYECDVENFLRRPEERFFD